MSALGQKRTCAMQKGMSALPPKATSNAARCDVPFGPKPDIAFLFDDLVGACEQPVMVSAGGERRQSRLRVRRDRYLHAQLLGNCEEERGLSQLNSDHATVPAPINPNHTITALHLPLGPPEQRGCLLEAAAQRSFSRAQSPQL